MNRFETYIPSARAAYALLVVGAVVWGSGIVIGRGVHEAIPPIGLGFWRAIVALVLLLPVVLPDLGRVKAILRRHWRVFVALGFLQVWPQALMLLALNYTTAINVTLVNGAQPAMAAIAMGILYRDRVTRGQAIGIVLALAGIVVMVSRGDWQTVATLQFNGGDWLALGCIVLFSLYSILLPRVPHELGLTTMLFLISLCGAVTIFPVYLYESLFVRAMDFNGVTVVTVLWMGAVISAASILLWNMCLRAIGTQKATIFLNLNPVFAAIFAIVFLGEQLHLYHLGGAVLVGGGITLVIRLARQAPIVVAKAEA